ncbi:MAG: DUF4358 domain-containing protein [Butyrivibrio sp.]
MSLRVKELLVTACLIAFIFAVSRQNNYIDTDVDTIFDSVSKEIETDSMEKFDFSRFKKDFGLNSNDYEGVIYYGHESVMNSETLLIIKVSDSSQGKEILNIISDQNESSKEMFKSYAPDQYELLSDSVLEQKGNYILYVVSENAKDAKKAFIDCITG